MSVLKVSPRVADVSASTVCVFAHGDEVLIADGGMRVLTPPIGDVAAAAADLFGSARQPELVFGALPFARTSACLLAPDSVTRTRRRAWADAFRTPPTINVVRTLTAEPSREAYAELVVRALADISETVLQKVVLARRLSLAFEDPIDLWPLVARLSRDPQATGFCLPLSSDGEAPRHFVGATPELLLAKSGTHIRSTPLAGSAPRRADEAADRAAADSLRQSEKDRREHRATVEWIGDQLAPYCRALTVPSTPEVTGTNDMWHLGTSIHGQLRDGGVPSLELVLALHPTPAVCGTPQDLAGATIARLEPFDRGFYGGVVGWNEPNGDGRWHVAIRCAEITGAAARLYAGAGVVAGSTPFAEADETSAKFRTLLTALGIDECGRQLRG